MSKNIEQVFVANPITSNTSTDLMYFGQSPYGVGNDAAMTYANFSAQFASNSLTASRIYMGNFSNIAEAVNLGGDLSTAYVGAGSARATVVRINGNIVGDTTPAAGQVLLANGVLWQAISISGDAKLVSSGALTVSKIGGVAISLAGSFTTSGAFAVTQTYTGATNVTFPTSGTLATTSQIPTGAALTKTDDTNVTLTLGGSPTTALVNAASITAGWTGTLSGTRGGTGVNNGASTITIGGNVTYSGAFTFTGTLTNTTSVTFPTSGTLATISQLPTPAALTKTDDTNVTLTLGGTPSTALLQATSITAGWTGTLAGSRGGLGAAITASNGGIYYSTASNGALLAGTATANQVLLSGSSTTPAWSTATYPATTTINQILYSSSANTIAGLATANNGVLITSATGVPSLLANSGTAGFVLTANSGAPPSWQVVSAPSSAALTKSDDTNVTLTLGGTPSIALLQATSITAGWTGTLSGTRGGTGVNNGASTITLGGSLTTSGAFASTFTMTNTTSVTFPTSGTLATTSQITGLTWNDVSGTTQSAVVNNGYIISNAAQTTVTIPATAAEGSLFAVQGKGAAGWILQMNTGQICHLGSSATSSAGTLTSTNLWDAIEIICVTANTTFAVRSAVGNITVA